jgi:protein-tyrosine phosphatase
VVDFHSHILPYIDDGAKNFDMSLDMLRISQGEGVEYVCATPHFIPGEIELDRKTFDVKLDNLIKLAEYKEIKVKLLSGMEIYITPELSKLYSEKRIWGLNDSSYLLIELPMQEVPLYTEEVLYELRLLGVTSIIAHPERNIAFMEDQSILVNILKQGTLAQVNSGSLQGFYGKNIKSFAEHLVKNNMINLLGSDGHNNGVRSTKIIDALECIKKLNLELYQWMELNNLRVIQGMEVEPLGIKKAKKTLGFNKVFQEAKLL